MISLALPGAPWRSLTLPSPGNSRIHAFTHSRVRSSRQSLLHMTRTTFASFIPSLHSSSFSLLHFDPDKDDSSIPFTPSSIITFSSHFHISTFLPISTSSLFLSLSPFHSSHRFRDSHFPTRRLEIKSDDEGGKLIGRTILFNPIIRESPPGKRNICQSGP